MWFSSLPLPGASADQGNAMVILGARMNTMRPAHWPVPSGPEQHLGIELYRFSRSHHQDHVPDFVDAERQYVRWEFLRSATTSGSFNPSVSTMPRAMVLSPLCCSVQVETSIRRQPDQPESQQRQQNLKSGTEHAFRNSVHRVFTDPGPEKRHHDHGRYQRYV